MLKKTISRNSQLNHSVFDYIDSLDRAIAIFDYHKCEAYAHFKEIEPKNQREAISFILSCGEERTSLDESILILQAHLQSAFYNVRSMYEIYAQLINKLILESELQVHECSIERALNKLIVKIPSDSLTKLIQNVRSDDCYSYVEAFINTIKHRNLLKMQRTLKIQENNVGVLIQGFKYKGNYYQEKWFLEALDHGVTARNYIINLGHALNEKLA